MRLIAVVCILVLSLAGVSAENAWATCSASTVHGKTFAQNWIAFAHSSPVWTSALGTITFTDDTGSSSAGTVSITQTINVRGTGVSTGNPPYYYTINSNCDVVLRYPSSPPYVEVYTGKVTQSGTFVPNADIADGNQQYIGWGALP
jgi:hypothetical protein